MSSVYLLYIILPIGQVKMLKLQNVKHAFCLCLVVYCDLFREQPLKYICCFFVTKKSRPKKIKTAIFCCCFLTD